jgi:flagellar protein FliS
MSYKMYESYLESQISSATPLELVALLYRAAIDSLEASRRHLASQDVPSRIRSTNRAKDILIELTQSSNREAGGELTERLIELYDYILRRLHHASLQADDAAYSECIQLLSTLLEAWSSIATPVQHQHVSQDYTTSNEPSRVFCG